MLSQTGNPMTPRSLDSSNATNAVTYLRLQQEHGRSLRILRADRLSDEWKLANSAKLAPKNFFAHINRNRRMGIRIQRLLHPNDAPATTDQEKADLLEQTFQGFDCTDKGSTPTFYPHTEIRTANPHITESETQ